MFCVFEGCQGYMERLCSPSFPIPWNEQVALFQVRSTDVDVEREFLAQPRPLSHKLCEAGPTRIPPTCRNGRKRAGLGRGRLLNIYNVNMIS